MYNRSITVLNKVGLHARPASQLVKASRLYKSEIRLLREIDRINPKSMIELLAAGIKNGTRIIVEAEGEDEIAAVDRLIDLIEQLNHEE